MRKMQLPSKVEKNGFDSCSGKGHSSGQKSGIARVDPEAVISHRSAAQAVAAPSRRPAARPPKRHPPPKAPLSRLAPAHRPPCT